MSSVELQFECDFVVNGRTITVTENPDGSYELPTLYGVDKLNRIKGWRVYIVGDTYHRESWVEGGVVKTYEGVKAVSMNVGRSNGTTPQEQAIFEAHAEWKKKKDQCYKEEYPVLKKKGDVQDIDYSALRPMLAQKYEERKKYLKFPCGASYKMDGVRALIYNDPEDGETKILSRTGKEFNHMNLIRRQCEYLFEKFGPLILDGEIYSHNLPFNVISGMARSKNKPHPLEDKMEFWIFDIVDLEKKYIDRARVLSELEGESKMCPNLKFVTYDEVKSEAEITTFHNKYVQLGFEGLILRNLDGMYSIKHRVNDLLKYKEFDDKEFLVVAVNEGVGSEAGAAIFVCAGPNNQTFTVRPRGDIAKRKWQYKNRRMYVGKMLTVRYQPSKEDVLPRFPVGITFPTDVQNLEKKHLEAVDLRDYE